MRLPKTTPRWIRTSKTALLLLLVAISAVLSYQLWIGFWKTTGDQVGTEVLPTPSASTPTQDELLRPSDLVVTDQDSGKAVVMMPGHADFNAWRKALSKLYISGLRQENVDTTQLHKTVTFDFGYTLNTNQLIALIPTLSHYGVNLSANQILMNEDPWTDSVSLVFSSSYGNESFSTEMSTRQFMHLFDQSMQRPGWKLAAGSDAAYLPIAPMTMERSVWTTRSPSQMTLVRSFFVNPLALTSLTGNGNSNIWTDGSRIVWWNQPTGSLTFQDPNASAVSTASLPTVDVAVNFIRAHGGCPSNGVAIASSSVPKSTWMDAFSIRPVVDGYPIVDGSADYQVQFEAGQIMEYTRPIWTLVDKLSSKRVRILDYSQLTARLQAESPGFTWSRMSAELGYATHLTKRGNLVCEPVYIISSNGFTFWTLSAVTGKPLKGVGNA